MTRIYGSGEGRPQRAERLARPVTAQVVAGTIACAHVAHAPATPPAGEPVTVTETLAGDTSIREANPATNYGTATTLPAGCGATLAARFRSLVHVRGSLANVPAGATIAAATLTLYVESESTTTDRTLGIHRSLVEFYPSEDGTGSQSTWNNQIESPTTPWPGEAAGGTAGADYETTPTDTATVTGTGTTIEFDVTADVAAMHAGTAPYYGWWIISQAEGVTNSLKQLSSLNSATPGQRPVLSITYTP